MRVNPSDGHRPSRSILVACITLIMAIWAFSVSSVLCVKNLLFTGCWRLPPLPAHSLIFCTLITTRSPDGRVTIPFTVIRRFSTF